MDIALRSMGYFSQLSKPREIITMYLIGWSFVACLRYLINRTFSPDKVTDKVIVRHYTLALALVNSKNYSLVLWPDGSVANPNRLVSILNGLNRLCQSFYLM